MNNPVRNIFPRRGENVPRAFPTEQELTNMQDGDRTAEVEADIREAMGTVRTAPDVGELSASAIKQRFEEGAEAMEKMAADLVDNLNRNQAQTVAVVEAHERLRMTTAEVVEQCKRTADDYRREAELHGERIKAASDLAGHVKQVCEEMSERITSS